MNIDAILPLLLNNEKNADIIKIMTALKSGGKQAAIEALLPKDKKAEPLINALKSASKKPPAAGLGAIEGFASNEILGMLVKYYAY
ncbi:MAG: hypothetical protein IKC48_01090 [Clostridia bacterium]|nr:hypothetical protein [Clostridia bacterium]